MLDLIKKQYEKYKEIINYLIFGVLTTVINFVVYIIFSKWLHINETVSNAIAWIVSVAFAYITNKIYVFNSHEKQIKQLIKEIISFVGCRLLSGVFDIVAFYVFVNIIHVNDLISKAIISVLVVILNYVFSKLLIFRKKKE